MPATRLRLGGPALKRRRHVCADGARRPTRCGCWRRSTSRPASPWTTSSKARGRWARCAPPPFPGDAATAEARLAESPRAPRTGRALQAPYTLGAEDVFAISFPVKGFPPLMCCTAVDRKIVKELFDTFAGAGTLESLVLHPLAPAHTHTCTTAHSPDAQQVGGRARPTPRRAARPCSAGAQADAYPKTAIHHGVLEKSGKYSWSARHCVLVKFKMYVYRDWCARAGARAPRPARDPSASSVALPTSQPARLDFRAPSRNHSGPARVIARRAPPQCQCQCQAGEGGAERRDEHARVCTRRHSGECLQAISLIDMGEHVHAEGKRELVIDTPHKTFKFRASNQARLASFALPQPRPAAAAARHVVPQQLSASFAHVRRPRATRGSRAWAWRARAWATA